MHFDDNSITDPTARLEIGIGYLSQFMEDLCMWGSWATHRTALMAWLY